MPTKKKTTAPGAGEHVVADVNVHHDGHIYYANWPHLERVLPDDVIESLLATGGAHIEKVD